MEKERKNFVYGNPEEGVLGCVNNGIDEKIAKSVWCNNTNSNTRY